MTEWDQITGAFRGHDGCNARNAKHISLVGSAGLDNSKGFGVHEDCAASNGRAVGLRLIAHVNHVCLSVLVKVGQAAFIFCGVELFRFHGNKVFPCVRFLNKNGYHSTVKIMSSVPFDIARRFLRLTLMLVGSLLFWFSVPAFAQGNDSLPSLGDTARDALSPAQERKLGKAIMQHIRHNRDYLDDAPVQEYLNGMGNKLLSFYPEARTETGQDFFFFAVRDPMINAFALPGGYIGIHSALILVAKKESELASVMAHEIGHVAQRHIARMMGKQQQDLLIPIATAVLAAAAARSGGDAPVAILAGGMGLAKQRQLNYSRLVEREADRIGFKILREAGYDASGMTVFFGRMQTAARARDDSTPSYLRTHPMTTERIADIQARIREQPQQQHVDSLNFHLIRARLRVLQETTTNGLLKVTKELKSQIDIKNPMPSSSAFYGLALVAYKRGELAISRTLLQQARQTVKDQDHYSKNALFASLSIDLRIAAGQFDKAIKEAAVARKVFPASRGLSLQYAEALYVASRYKAAESFLIEQVLNHREEPKFQRELAKTYSKQGKVALMHLALAEAYGLSGNLSSALEQLTLARRAPDATYYEQSVIDVRERHWQTLRLEQLKKR